jgi:hypothetical protein
LRFDYHDLQLNSNIKKECESGIAASGVCLTRRARNDSGAGFPIKSGMTGGAAGGNDNACLRSPRYMSPFRKGGDRGILHRGTNLPLPPLSKGAYAQI